VKFLCFLFFLTKTVGNLVATNIKLSHNVVRSAKSNQTTLLILRAVLTYMELLHVFIFELAFVKI